MGSPRSTSLNRSGVDWAGGGGISMWESGAGPRASSPKVNKSKQVCSGQLDPFREQTDRQMTDTSENIPFPHPVSGGKVTLF